MQRGGARRTIARVAALLRRHWLFALVLAAAALVRLAMILTFWPALFYPGDSFGYLASAYGQTFVRFDVVHPSGYPLVIELLSLPGRSAATLAIAQHVAGLAIGVLVYVLLAPARRQPLPRRSRRRRSCS